MNIYLIVDKTRWGGETILVRVSKDYLSRQVSFAHIPQGSEGLILVI